MNLSPLPLQKFFDNAGVPLNGGKLFTYVAGTTTKLATFQDQAGTPNTNPIVLNFRGEANVWLDQTLTYKFVLAPSTDTDPPTNPVWTVDNISAAVTFASLTASIIGLILYPRTPAEIAAGVTPTNYAYEPGDPRGSVFRYGAVCNGVTNDATAVQNALNVTGLVTFPPNGSVKVNTGLTMDASTTTLDGQGAQLVSGLSGAGNLIKVGSSNGGEACTRNALRRLFISGTSVVGVIGIDFEGASNIAGFTVDRVSINGFETGVRIFTNAFCINFEGCLFTGCSNVVFVPGGGSNYGEKISFNHCFWANNTTRCLYSTYNACQFYVVNSSLDYSKTVCEVNQGRAYFDNCYLESNLDTAYWFIAGATESCYIRWRGGQIAIAGAKTAFSLANADTGSVIEFDNTDFFSNSDSVGGHYLGTGAGATYAENSHITGFVHNALAWAGPSPSQNLCDNGTFATALTGWTLASTGGALIPARNATGGSTGGPSMEFHTDVVGKDSRATWTVAAVPGRVAGVTMGIKGENVAAKFLFVLQAIGTSGAVIATSDILGGFNQFGAGVNFPDTSFHTYRNAFSRLPAGTTSIALVMVSDYSAGFKVEVENVVLCIY